MKRLKLKCTQPPNEFDQFNDELEDYCNSPKNKNPIFVPYKWYHTDEQWPPDKNEDILIFNDGSCSVERAYVSLQNLIYRTKVMKLEEGTKFYWKKIKTPTGKPQYDPD